MNFKFLPMACLLTSALLTGCSSSSSSSSSNETSNPANDNEPVAGAQGTAQYNGNYVFPCDGDFGFSDRFELSIQGSVFTATSTEYSDETCTNLDSTIVSTFSLVYPGGTTETPRGMADHIDVSLESITFDGVPPDADALATLEGLGVFDTVYAIILLDGASFYLSDESDTADGTTAEMRHDTLDEIPGTRL